MIELIAHITDPHLDEAFPFKKQKVPRKRLYNILEDIEKKKCSRIVCTGDIGENTALPCFFSRLEGTSFFLTPGNHDQYVAVASYYTRGIVPTSEKIYTSTQNNTYKTIYLDSSASVIDDEQLHWLANELLTSLPVVIFIHHPVLGLEGAVDKIGHLQNREAVVAILTKTTSQVTIFCGHYHMDDCRQYKNITQYITPAIAYQIKTNPDAITVDTTVSGYRMIYIEEGKISSTVTLFHYAD